MVFERLPAILVVQLKRFDSSMQKNNSICNIATKIEMRDLCPRDDPIASTIVTQYRLGAIIMHGSQDGNLHNGHYWAFARVKLQTSGVVWMEFNDKQPRQRTTSYVLNLASGYHIRGQSAYIVFYHRIDKVNDILQPPWDDSRTT